MKSNIESIYTSNRAKTWFPNFIADLVTTRPGTGMSLVVLGLLFAFPCAKAEATVSAVDSDFILAAAQGGMTEVKLGELAGRKATRDDVKAFGQMMVKDHTVINNELKALAGQKGVPLTDGLDAKHQGMVDKMSALTGSDFDDAYIAGMTKAHIKDDKTFKAESATTQDADIKSFVDKSIPVVDRHLKHITDMKK